MNNELPPFRRVKRAYASSIVHSVLAGPGGPALLQLREYDDGHFRAVFSISYFQLTAERTRPSKSQWNTLKKRLKRRDRTIFVFRKYGEIDCPRAAQARRNDTCLYLDFGFLPD